LVISVRTPHALGAVADDGAIGSERRLHHCHTTIGHEDVCMHTSFSPLIGLIVSGARKF
jgi:hypothetical protein